jgi:hypothetical protein
MNITKLKLRSPFYKTEVELPEASVVGVKCYHCGRVFTLSVSNVRVYNYCTSCR